MSIIPFLSITYPSIFHLTFLILFLPSSYPPSIHLSSVTYLSLIHLSFTFSHLSSFILLSSSSLPSIIHLSSISHSPRNTLIFLSSIFHPSLTHTSHLSYSSLMHLSVFFFFLFSWFLFYPVSIRVWVMCKRYCACEGYMNMKDDGTHEQFFFIWFENLWNP